MAKQEGNAVSAPVIIAMKGHPGTGKTTLSRSLASTLKIPLIDKDDVRGLHVDSARNRSPIFLAKRHVVPRNLAAGVDPATTRARRHRGLAALQAGPPRPAPRGGGGGVVVVECKPADEDEWRQRLERRDEATWHKPCTWREMERLFESYDGCTDYDVGDVPKVVVDTTAGIAVQELVYPVVEFIKTHCGF